MNDNNQDFLDEIIKLRLLHSLRENMQRYSRGEREISMPDGSTQIVANNIIETYFAILKKQKTQEDIFNTDKRLIDYVYNVIKQNSYPFNPQEYKTTKAAEDKARNNDAEKVRKRNILIENIKKAIIAEIEHKNEKDKREGRPIIFSINDEPISISLSSEKINPRSVGYFEIKFANKEEPLKINIYTNGKQFGSMYGLSDKGLGNDIYNGLLKEGEGEFILTKQSQSSSVGKHYSPAEYKRLSGIKDSKQYGPELEVLKSLCASDQEKFLEGLKKRKTFLGLKEKLLAEVSKYYDKFKKLKKIDTLQDLYKYSNLIKELLEKPLELEVEGRPPYDVKDKLISSFLPLDNETWGNYSKNHTDEREEHSYYEKLIIHMLNSKNSGGKKSCDDICKDILSSSSENIEQDIYNAFNEIQHIANPMLPRKLTAEILTYGVFQAALSNPSDENFKRMNKILNEFGLNIKLKQIEITSLPDDSIQKASDQYAIDRAKFADTKKYDCHQKREKEFDNYARQNGVKEIINRETHHYDPLKYNAYVEANLNHESNYVIVGRQHPWNVDAHAMVHLFSTTGEFLIKSETGEFNKQDFNGVKKLKNRTKDKKLYIISPVLQVKKNGKFEDLLPVQDAKGNGGFYLSTDHTPDIINIPEYCGSITPPSKTKPSLKKDQKTH